MLPKIVFVHLNSSIPHFLKMNIQSTIKKFPESRVVLIHNSDSRIRINSNVETFRYTSNANSASILNHLSHPREFRNNFWFSSIQRFDALRQYLVVNPGPIVHLESDIIISADFPLTDFNLNGGQLAFPAVAVNRGVASSLYLSDVAAAERLVKLSIELSEMVSTTTDMEILAKFNEVYPDHTFNLSFGPNAAEAYETDFVLEWCKPSFEKFKGVFDGNDIGVYLFGSDPRNTRGISYLGRSIPGNFAKIQTWGFVYDPKRQFLNVEFKGQALPIFSIHATSKRLLIFNHYTQNWMIKTYLKKAVKSVKSQIYPIVFMTMGMKKIAKLIYGQKNTR